MCGNVRLVCKRWRYVTRLAWSTRQRICIDGRNIKSYDEHLLTTILTSKHIGHGEEGALARRSRSTLPQPGSSLPTAIMIDR